MAVTFILNFSLISKAPALASIIGRSLGLTGLTGKSLADAIIGRTKGKSDKQKRDIFQAATEPTHVQFINPDDASTSETCEAVLSGQHVWIIGDPAIQIPPLHYNCRSSLVFIRP